jgi:hypothetical protein
MQRRRALPGTKMTHSEGLNLKRFGYKYWVENEEDQLAGKVSVV